MIKRITLLALVSSVVLFACKKSDSPSTPPVTTDSVAILGKWSLVRNVSYDYAAGVFVDSSFEQVSALDYSYFDTNGKAYYYENDASNNNIEYRDTTAYLLLPNRLLVFIGPHENDTLKISTLTSHSLILTDSYLDTRNGSGNVSTYDTVQYVK